MKNVQVLINMRAEAHKEYKHEKVTEYAAADKASAFV